MNSTVTQISTNPPAATEAAKKAKRLIYQALEDYYDDVNGRYREGYDDARIAKELGASVEFVRSIRENDFGPIKAPDEFTAFSAKLKAANDAIDAAVAKIAAIQAELTATAKRKGWQ